MVIVPACVVIPILPDVGAVKRNQTSLLEYVPQDGLGTPEEGVAQTVV